MIAALCEDDRAYIESMTAACDTWLKEHPSSGLIVMQYDCPEDLLEAWESGIIFDIFFLDIEFQNMDGFTLAQKIRERDQSSIIVFVTNSRYYALAGYDLSIYRYLLKPIDQKAIFNCLDYCNQQNLSFSDASVSFLQAGGSIRFRLKDIMHIDAYLHTLRIFTADGKETSVRYYENLDLFMERLPRKWFSRCSRSTIINLLYVKQYTHSKIQLRGVTAAIPVGRKYQDEVFKQLQSYFWGDTYK